MKTLTSSLNKMSLVTGSRKVLFATLALVAVATAGCGGGGGGGSSSNVTTNGYGTGPYGYGTNGTIAAAVSDYYFSNSATPDIELTLQLTGTNTMSAGFSGAVAATGNLYVGPTNNCGLLPGNYPVQTQTVGILQGTTISNLTLIATGSETIQISVAQATLDSSRGYTSDLNGNTYGFRLTDYYTPSGYSNLSGIYLSSSVGTCSPMAFN